MPLIITFVVFAAAIRFVGLEHSPPGFYIDEAAIAAQVICIRQTGMDAQGRSWPLMTDVLGGGYATPATLYSGAMWTAAFGDSIASFRAFAAFHGALTVIGVFLLAFALWRRRDLAWLAALACAIAPSGFLFSRIFWDVPLAPCELIWGLALLTFAITGSPSIRIRNCFAVGAGLFLALACYSYPPMRVQAVLFVPAFVGFLLYSTGPTNRRPGVTAVLVAFVAAVLALVPLAVKTMSGEIQGRFQMLSIAGDYYHHQFGGFTWSKTIETFAANIMALFSPHYLLISGDGNLRHSTQAVGQWSWLECFALLCLVFLIAMKKLNRRNGGLVGLLAWGYFAGILPAALTWESNPHALRSIGSYPFLAMVAGFALAEAGDVWRWSKILGLAIALAFAGYYGYDFVAGYPQRSAGWFDVAIVDASRKAENVGAVPSQMIGNVDPNYAELARLYYDLRSGVRRCH